MRIEDKPGFCTLCRSRCGTTVTVAGGQLVSVRPNPAHPTGKAMCPKGRAAPEIAHSARRLTTPLRRTTPRGAADPAFKPISWDEALDEIAEKLNAIRAESGPEAVAFAVTSGSSSSMSDALDWVQRLIRSFGSPNTIFATEVCNWHKDHAHAFTFGCGIPTADYLNSDLILLWGHNPANVWLAQAEAVGTARARGAKVVVIDPRQTGMARDADLWLRVRPGTDAALALGVARALIARGGYDRDFVEGWTNGPLLVRTDTGRFLRGAEVGLEEDAAYVMWDEAAGRPVSSEDRSGKPRLSGGLTLNTAFGPIACRTAFDLYEEALAPYDPATVEAITGVPARDVEVFADLIAAAGSVAYHAWTGLGQHTNATQTERAVASLYALTGSFDIPGGNVRRAAHPVPALHSMAMIEPGTRAKALGLADRPLGPPVDGWITSTDFYDAVLEGKPYPIRALMTFGSNLLVSHPEPERGAKALDTLEFQVHCDLFLNPTAEHADIVLPVTSSYEHEALRVGFEITHAAQELVQLRPQMIPRQGDTRSDQEIVFALAPRLGLGETFFGGDMDAGWNHMLAPLGLDVARLRQHPEGISLPLTQTYRKYRDTGFATQTRRVELYSELFLRHGYDPLPRFVPPARTPDGDFPLVLFSANNGYFCHSQQRGITALRKKRGEPLAEIHPDTAATRGIAEGDAIRVRTPRGAISVKAKLNTTLAPDTVACDYGWWQGAPDLGLPAFAISAGAPGAASYNAVIPEADRDPVSGSLPLRSYVCEVELDASVLARRWPGWRTFRVAARRDEPGEVAALTLVPEDGGLLPPFRPGQFVTVRVDGQTRSYSLTGPVEAAPTAYSIAVRRLPGGAVSEAIFAGLKEGARLDLQAPAGNFVMPLENEFPVVLIAGGIGITPFLSYLESLDGKAGEPQVELHYGCRSAAEQPFAARLAVLAQRLPNLKLTTYLTRPETGARCDVEGRFCAADLPQALIEARARFYLCGSDAMMDEAVALLKGRGVPAFEIFRERFRSPAGVPEGDLSPRTLTFSRSGRTLTWTPEAGALLACAEKAGLTLPSGCRTGQCESCKVTVVSGQVLHLVPVEDEEEGACLACQAVPLTDLVLDA